MNRCSGLLFAREKLQREVFTDDDADFVCRNFARRNWLLATPCLPRPANTIGAVWSGTDG